MERIIEHALASRPDLLIVDSIQTVTLDALDGPAGSVGQVREAASRLLGFAKDSGVPVVLVGHVTKDGSLAGPKTLEHLVDAVLALEGERFGTLRLLRATKNRFGSTEEVGVLEMAGSGLREVPDPGARLPWPGHRRGGHGRGRDARGQPAAARGGAGARRAGRRVRRAAADRQRHRDAAAWPCSSPCSARRVGLDLGGQDIYASLAGGLSVAEPALDLPLAVALGLVIPRRAGRPGHGPDGRGGPARRAAGRSAGSNAAFARRPGSASGGP